MTGREAGLTHGADFEAGGYDRTVAFPSNVRRQCRHGHPHRPAVDAIPAVLYPVDGKKVIVRLRAKRGDRELHVLVGLDSALLRAVVGIRVVGAPEAGGVGRHGARRRRHEDGRVCTTTNI